MEEAFRLFKSTREYFTPVLTETAFYDKGMLTPEEFVRAGDQLIRNCPSWRWETGEPSKVRPYLPADKQFLSTRGVPSYSRVSVLQASKVVEEVVKGGMGDAEGDWCAPELLKPDEDDADEVLVRALSRPTGTDRQGRVELAFDFTDVETDAECRPGERGGKTDRQRQFRPAPELVY